MEWHSLHQHIDASAGVADVTLFQRVLKCYSKWFCRFYALLVRSVVCVALITSFFSFFIFRRRSFFVFCFYFLNTSVLRSFCAHIFFLFLFTVWKVFGFGVVCENFIVLRVAFNTTTWITVGIFFIPLCLLILRLLFSATFLSAFFCRLCCSWRCALNEYWWFAYFFSVVSLRCVFLSHVCFEQ